MPPAVAPAPAPAPVPAAPAPDPKAIVPAPAPAPAPDAGKGTPAPDNDAKGYWPEDWQARLAGEDKDELKQISRYQSPADIWKKARSLEKRLSSGEYRAVLPKDPTPEDLAAWRKDNDIPEAPEKYDLKGVKIADIDKDIVAGFLKAAHGANMTPAQAKVAVESYYAEQERQFQVRAEKDETQRQATLDALNTEWGAGYRRNINLIKGTILAKFPEDVRDLIASARLPDGTAVFNNVSAVKGLAALALEINPAGIVAPGGQGDIAKAALDEYRELQTFMREKRTAYNKDSAKQERMMALIEHLRKQDLIDDHGNIVQKRQREI